MLTLIDTDGTAVILRPDTEVYGYSDPADTDIRANYLIRVDEVQHRVREDLIRDFTWNPATGTLTPRPDAVGVRFIDNDGHPVILAGGRKVTATPLPGGESTTIRNPATGIDHTIGAAVAKAAGLGGLKHPAGPLFRDGAPSAEDPRQGTLGDCDLIEPMKNNADRNPDGILTMVRAYDDNTYAVLFIIDGEPVWKRVTSDLYVDADGHTPHARHQDGDPLWPAIIEKARAALRDQQDTDSTAPAPRARYDETGMQPPPAEALEVSAEPASVVTLSRQVLTLIDAHGTPITLHRNTTMRRDPAPPPAGIPNDGTYQHISVFHDNGARSRHWVHADLIRDFRWNQQTGILTRPRSGVRFLDDNGEAVLLPGGSRVIAEPFDDNTTILTHPVTDEEHPLPASVAQAAGLGALQEHTGPLFGDNGPSPDDPQQGSLGNCHLIAPMKNAARQNPDALIKTLHDYKDNTYGVLFFDHDTPHMDTSHRLTLRRRPRTHPLRQTRKRRPVVARDHRKSLRGATRRLRRLRRASRRTDQHRPSKTCSRDSDRGRSGRAQPTRTGRPRTRTLASDAVGHRHPAPTLPGRARSSPPDSTNCTATGTTKTTIQTITQLARRPAQMGRTARHPHRPGGSGAKPISNGGHANAVAGPDGFARLRRPPLHPRGTRDLGRSRSRP